MLRNAASRWDDGLIDLIGLRFLDGATCSAILTVFVGLFVVLALRLPRSPREAEAKAERLALIQRAGIGALIVGPGGIGLSLLGIREDGLNMIGSYVLLILLAVLMAVSSVMILHALGIQEISLENLTQAILLSRKRIPRDSWLTPLAWVLAILIFNEAAFLALGMLAPTSERTLAHISDFAAVGLLSTYALGVLYSVLLLSRFARWSRERRSTPQRNSDD